MSDEAGIPSDYRTGQTLLAAFARDGDQHAFEELVRLYAGMVYNVCLGVTKNAHDAEDAAQATFLSLATQVKLGKSVDYLGPWLKQVAKRTALDLKKSRTRRERRQAKHAQESSLETADQFAGASLDADLYKQALHEEVSQLPERYRAPLVMHYFTGLPHEQTAAELNCKPKTLAVRLHRGRKMLAQRLSRRGIFAGGEMLGIASAPFMHQFIGKQFFHQTAHAAAAMSGGRELSSLVATRVAALLQSTAKVALFAKIKMVAIALVITTALVAGGARAAREAVISQLNLPAMKSNLGNWMNEHFLKPMLRSMAPSKLIASADVKSSASAKSDVAIVAVHTDSLIGGESFDTPSPLANAAVLTLDPTSSRAVQTQLAFYSPTVGANLHTNFSLDDRSLFSARSLHSRSIEVPFSIAPAANSPEPASLLLLFAGGTLIWRRKPIASRSA